MQKILQQLQQIPGVGGSIAADLYGLGVRSVDDLKGRDPEELYAAQGVIQGQQVDRCLLYVFRCAVYYASEKTHDPELLKWWNWKDRNQQQSARPGRTSIRRRRTAPGNPAS